MKLQFSTIVYSHIHHKLASLELGKTARILAESFPRHSTAIGNHWSIPLRSIQISAVIGVEICILLRNYFSACKDGRQ